MTAAADVARRLARYRRRALPGQHRFVQAAVAVIFRDRDEGGLELCLIRRAERRGDPWSGNMAFPGGKLSAGDADPAAAAVRETREEIGVDLDVAGTVIGGLSSQWALTHSGRRLMAIHPVVFHLRRPAPVTPDPREVAEVVWIPLAFLADRSQRTRVTKRILGVPWRFSAWRYDGRVVWGLTQRMLRELLRALR